jgi:hypothetical protein
MSAASYVHHLTIDSGHARRSWRHEIEPAALAASRALLQRALTAPDGAPVPLPVPLQRYHMAASAPGRCLVAVVSADDGGQLLQLITLGVAPHSRCGATLWRRLMQGDAAQPPPPAPWCAVRLHPHLAAELDAAYWLGDYERCIAWAWLDLLAQRRAQSATPDGSHP